jgi:hypothetical protein
MGKSTISMAIFNSYVKLPEGIHNFHQFYTCFSDQVSLPWRSLLQLAAGGWSALAVACGKQAAWSMASSLLEVGPWWPHAEVGPWGVSAGYSRMVHEFPKSWGE